MARRGLPKSIHPDAASAIPRGFRRCSSLPICHYDHDSIFSASLDAALSDFGVRILRTPVQAPTANAYCERLVGTIRRECLDYLIPVNERHLHLTLREFAAYYNRARPHSALGPGTPEPILPGVVTSNSRHQLPTGCSVRSKPVLGGLHHDYRLEREAA